MAGTDPGDRIPTSARPRARRLSEPPSARFSRRPSTSESAPNSGAGSLAALRGPLIRAVLVAIIGALALVLVGGVLSSTFGLLFIAGVMGAIVGLVTARAAVPDDGSQPVPRRTVLRAAIGVALAGVAAGELGLWLFALNEGGDLAPFDYLWSAFGLFAPGVPLVAIATAWWGATAGPVQR